MARLQLLIGSAAFWDTARQDIAAARRRVLVQAMTFEGDAAGLPVAQAIGSSAAPDRRVLVDDYSRHVLSDRFLALSRDPAIAAEAQATWAMFDRLLASGVGVRVTEPIGGNPLRYPLRNHKKLLVMDDVAWLGGINFSEHNFAWHDLMLRIEDAAVADWLAAQFAREWEGRPEPARARIGEIDLVSLTGVDNAAQFRPLVQALAQARRSVEVLSAYLTFPFVGALAAAALHGAKVTVYTPEPNNKPGLRDYILAAARNTGIKVRLMPEMTHMKAVLIDGTTLVLGSSNLDFVSHRIASDYVAVLRNPELIADFTKRVLAPARAASREPTRAEQAFLRTQYARPSLRLLDLLMSPLRHRKRIEEWRRP